MAFITCGHTDSISLSTPPPPPHAGLHSPGGLPLPVSQTSLSLSSILLLLLLPFTHTQILTHTPFVAHGFTYSASAYPIPTYFRHRARSYRCRGSNNRNRPKSFLVVMAF